MDSSNSTANEIANGMAEGHDPSNWIDALAEEFVSRLRNGERPTIAEYLERYPDLAEEIGDMFPTLAMLERFGGDVTSTGSSQISVPKLEQLGEYRIIREIGRGGMGVVYEAEHTAMRRRVALKVLPAELASSATQLRRFRREARAAGNLHHTNVVPVFEVGHQDGIYYYAMQYIRGQSLDLVIAELRKLSQAVASPTSDKTSRPKRTSIQMKMDSIAEGLLSGNLATATAQPAEAEIDSVSPTEKPNLPPPAEVTESVGAKLDEAALSSARRAGYFRCVARIGFQIADALAYAHAQGVLHRDVKPSNLILDTAGIVWLTDFGLAKYDEDGLTGTGDLAGTLRYMAPERLNGQADARSDVYALGLTLYELCTLRAAFDETDRVRLIKQLTNDVPPAPRKINWHIPLDLETVILKAIDKQPASRYQTADEMADDLRLFVADRPVHSRRSLPTERVWRWCRRNPAVASLAASVLLLLGVVFCGSIWFGISSSNQARELRWQTALALESEQKSLGTLYEALRSQAKAARFSGRQGQRVEGLKAVHEAVMHLPRMQNLKRGQSDARLLLRNEAIASLANADLRVDRSWTVDDSYLANVDFDANFQRYAQANSAGKIVVRRVSDDSEVASFPSPGYPAWDLRFSPDGKYVAAKYHAAGDSARQVSVWSTESQEQIVNVTGNLRYGRFAFSSDSRTFAVGMRDKVIRVFDLPAGTSRDNSPRIDSQPMELSFDPLGRWLVVSDEDTFSFERIRLSDGSREKILAPNCIQSFAWASDGSLLAGGCDDGNIYVWNPEKLSDPPRVLVGHTGQVVNLAFNRRGDRLVSYSWDGSSRLWDVRTSSLLVQTDSVRVVGDHFSPDDTRIGYATARDEFGIWEVLDRGPVYTLSSSAKGRSSIDYARNAKSLILSATSDGVELWNSSELRLLAVLPSGSTKMAQMLPDGSAIITSGKNGVQRWPITKAGSTWSIGNPESIASVMTERFDVDRETRRLSVLRNNKVISYDLREPSFPMTKFGEHNNAHHIASSSDGRWLVTTTWQLGGIKVWDCTRAELFKDLDPSLATTTAAFSPDGKWLATGQKQHISLWEVGTWNLVHRIDREVGDDWIGSVAFSPDSRILASLHTRHSIQFIETNSGTPLAMLESSKPSMIASMQFNADGSELAVHVGDLQIWRLNELQQELAKVDLDWGSIGSIPLGTSSSESPTKISVIDSP